MESVLAFVLLVLLAWVRGDAPESHDRAPARAAHADGARAGRTSGSCQSRTDCAWGYDCALGMCVEADCHGAHRVEGRAVPVRRCIEGYACTYDDGASAGHGVGYCDAR